ncbi:MAG: TonB-dependent receptor [Muribaculaceae bacterium]|nr:TonB-dependent receptor [Muribaculaceae bacterium]
MQFNHIMRIFTVILCCVALFEANASVISPQQESHGTEDADSVFYLLDELDVVALKQNVAFRAIPVSGTTVRGDDAERLGIGDVKGLSSVVPNFHIPDYGSRITSTIYVRGIGARMDQPAVGLTVDNVSILNKDAYDFDINDISYMEMLRGPQSALFGRNTMTGLINIRTLSPMEFTGWRGLVELGPRQLFKFNLGWYHRFRKNLGFSVTGSFYRRNGEFHNEYDGYPVDKEVNGHLRIKTVWSPLAGLNISNTLSQSLLRQGGYPYENVQSGKIDYNDTCFYKRYLLTDALTLSTNLGNVKLVSVTSVQQIDDNMTLDQDFLPQSYFTLTQKKQETAFTEDLMFRGWTADNRYQWLLGAYGFYRHLHMTAPVTFKEYGISHLIENNRNKVNPYFPIRWDEDEFPLNSDFTMPSWGLAAYHESRYELDNWLISAGIRFDYEHIGMKYNSWCDTSYTIYDNPTGQLPLAPAIPVYRVVPVELVEKGRMASHYFMCLPKLSLLWNLPAMTTSNLYASVGKGYKAGGYNTQMFSDVLQQRLMKVMGLGSQYDVEDIVSYRPEHSWTYEIGTHLNLLDTRINLDASVFYLDCRDQQMTVFPEGETTGRMMTNAGHTRSIGGEVSAYYTILPELTLMATYGFTDARFVDFYDGRENYKGKRLPYAPSNTLFAEASYMFNMSKRFREHYLAFNLNFSGTGDIYWNEANTLRQNFYGLLGGSLGYHTPRWSVEVWAKNLTGTKYYTFYFLSMGNEFRQRGHGRDFGVSIRARF